MLEFEVEAKVYYKCFVDGEKERLILEKANELKRSDGEAAFWSDNAYIDKAINQLYLKLKRFYEKNREMKNQLKISKQDEKPYKAAVRLAKVAISLYRP